MTKEGDQLVYDLFFIPDGKKVGLASIQRVTDKKGDIEKRDLAQKVEEKKTKGDKKKKKEDEKKEETKEEVPKAEEAVKEEEKKHEEEHKVKVEAKLETNVEKWE